MSRPFPKLRPDTPRAEKPFEVAIKKESDTLPEQISSRKPPLLDDLLFLTICLAYFEGLLGNVRINRYLRKNHEITLYRIEELVARIRLCGAESGEDTMTVWSISEARKELSKLVTEAQRNGPQLIRQRKQPIAIVVSMRRWNAMLRRHPELEEFFWQRKIRYSTKISQPVKVGQADDKQKGRVHARPEDTGTKDE
jgi:prevent-host-death family protein